MSAEIDRFYENTEAAVIAKFQGVQADENHFEPGIDNFTMWP